MRKIYLTILFSFVVPKLTAQVQQNYDFSTRFAFEANSTDDFFDRFNFLMNSRFSKYLLGKYPYEKFERKNLIFRLFNLGNKSNNIEEIKQFILQVTDTIQPQYLRYSDPEWYAELNCKILYQGNPAKLVLVLKVIKSNNNGYSWDIVSAKADFLKFRPNKSDSLLVINMKKTELIKDSNFFLSPVSHGIDFSNIDLVFLNKSKAGSYVYPGPISFELYKLIYKIKNSEIKLIQVDKIRYHLLQIDGWIIILDYFSRNNLNSGWLINHLLKANQEEKINYKKNALRIQL